MRDIAEAVGLQPGSIYSHFASKEEILRELLQPVIEPLAEDLREIAAGDGTGLERVRLMLSATLRQYLANKAEAIILVHERHLIDNQPTLAEVCDLTIGLGALWVSVVADGQADGSITDALPPALIARAIYGLMYSVTSDRDYGMRPDRATPSDEELERMVDVVLFRGIAR